MGPRPKRPTPHGRERTRAQRFKRTNPVPTRGPGRGLPARERACRCVQALSRYPGGPWWQGARGNARALALGAPPKPARRGHVAASHRRTGDGARSKRKRRCSAGGFRLVQRLGLRFSLQKHTTVHISLGLAPVLAPGAWFFSGFHYRSVEERDTDDREVGACLYDGGRLFPSIGMPSHPLHYK